MSLRDLPILRRLETIGPRDPVFDLLVLLGPVVLATIALGGRSLPTTVIAAAYLCAFPAYITSTLTH